MVGHVRMECGYKVTPKSVKDKLKGMFLPTVTDSYYCPLSKRMVEFVRPKSTRDLTVSEKYNFLTLIHGWAVDLSIPITMPEQSEFYQIRKEQGLAA